MARLARMAFLPVSVLVLFAGAALVPLPVFLEAPGATVGLGDAVRVDDDGDLNGDYLLTVVNLRRGTVLGLTEAVVHPSIDVVAAGRVVPPGEDDAAYFQRQRRVFDATVDVAAAVALRAAGHDVDPEALTGSGVLVVRVLAETPADGVLQAGDVIVAVDGEDVRVSADLREALQADPPAARRLTFRRDDERRTVELEPAQIPTPQGAVLGIGVEIETADPRIDLPVPVEVDSGRIGGPSAGLMLALTIFDKAAPVDLGQGRRIAGTGQLSSDGTVDGVGGVRQKILGARRDGADLFVLPRQQLQAVREAIGDLDGIELIGVSTFEEAVEVLLDGAAGSGGRAWARRPPPATMGGPPWSAPGGWW